MIQVVRGQGCTDVVIGSAFVIRHEIDEEVGVEGRFLELGGV